MPPQGGGWGQPPGPPPGSPTGYGAPPGYGQPPAYGGPPPGYGQPPAWGQPPPYGYGGYGAPQTDGKAVGALVTAILAWVVCPVVLAIVSLILASQSSRDIARSGGRLEGAGFNTAAKVISWINIAIFGLFLAILFIGAASSSTSGY
jgi:hypothetical protein